ncbi:unnamed protein product [Aspergillus oryzae]|nr:unnamed protein product [Aspergillus oryzae]GMF95032.1 unnamed protein product [Aspergillus oryzae]
MILRLSGILAANNDSNDGNYYVQNHGHYTRGSDVGCDECGQYQEYKLTKSHGHLQQQGLKVRVPKACDDNSGELELCQSWVLGSPGTESTHACKSTIRQIHAEGVQDEEPGLGVQYSVDHLIPKEFFRHRCRTSLVLECSLYCNCSFGLREERCFGGGVGENEEEDEGITRGDASKHEKQKAPALQSRRRISNSPCDDTADNVRDTVTDEPGCLSTERSVKSVTHILYYRVL